MASTSSQTPTSWDVFLSFRGEDTRYGFTSHLYSALNLNNIRTFMDDPEIRCGEVISTALLKAIQQSKVYVVVLSQNYASSPWCLNELVEIVNCDKTMHRLVIPVFYNIDPSVVRYQTGSFEEDFRRHENKYAGEIVENWRVTLKQVANNSGKHVDGKRSEARIVNEIVDEILLQIKPTALDVGMNSRVDDITALLSNGTKGLIKIGIYGMGGVGKTTLAKAVFNKLLGSFKGSCFLENVREISGTLKGLESLQQQLIKDVLKSKNKIEVSSVDHGIKLIEQNICSTKILVVIDDLEDHKKFESLVRPFAPGSVVIITTRDEEILDNIEVETQYRYRVNELGDAESETLFFQHAFRDTKPSSTLMILSKDILYLAGGLPLALEVIGSYLYKRSEVRWKSCIETLQRNPNSSIQQRLIISLDALESDNPLLKKMFLDIACFFIGWNKGEVVEILNTYYSYADDKIDILKKRCLLKINDRDELGMHDLLQDMGKEIARNNSPDEPGKHSRLWVPKEICDVLQEDNVITSKGTEGIMLRCFEPKDLSKKVSFAAETLKGMNKLRFLYFEDIILTGKFKRTPEDLRWFCWNRCPLKCLPFDFCPQKLVILELPHSRMTTMWEANMVSMNMCVSNMCFPHDLTTTPDFRRLSCLENLKTLNMSFSSDLTTTPDFRRLPRLKNLYLEGCRSLKRVHKSIGSLVSLVSLNLKDCVSLRSLPDTIGSLVSLVSLNLKDCVHLRSLPDDICKLKALEVLCIEGCERLKALPIQLGNIKSLTELNARRINVPKLPDSTGDLSKLVKLELDRNEKLESLPNTICNLRALEVLSIRKCTNVEALPVELGNIESLREIDAGCLALSKLPDSIGDLSKLVELKLDFNKKLESLPNTICNLRALELLSITGCTKVEALPVELGNIESLIELRAVGIAVTKLPDTICNMRSLEILDIKFCEKLETLPDQLWKLTKLLELDVSPAKLIKRLPDIESSKTSLSLRRLDISEGKITALPRGISQLTNLKYLDLRGCGHLLSIAELPPNLTDIAASYCTSLERVNLSNLKLLRELSVTGCSALTEISGLEELFSLYDLQLRGCHSSLLPRTLTKPLFQIYSGFKQEIGIGLEAKKIPDWITQSRKLLGFKQDGSRCSQSLQPNLSRNYLGMILCFDIRNDNDKLDYSVMTSASNILQSQLVLHGSSIVIVPRSIFTVTDIDHTIIVTSNARRVWIHLLYENEDDNHCQC